MLHILALQSVVLLFGGKCNLSLFGHVCPTKNVQPNILPLHRKYSQHIGGVRACTASPGMRDKPYLRNVTAARSARIHIWMYAIYRVLHDMELGFILCIRRNHCSQCTWATELTFIWWIFQHDRKSLVQQKQWGFIASWPVSLLHQNSSQSQ